MTFIADNTRTSVYDLRPLKYVYNIYIYSKVLIVPIPFYLSRINNKSFAFELFFICFFIRPYILHTRTYQYIIIKSSRISVARVHAVAW